MTDIRITPTTREDVPALACIAEEVGLFPANLLADMIEPYVQGAEDALWLTASLDETPIGLCFARTEPFADRVWNMLALGVSRAHQGHGAGRALVDGLETRLHARAARILLVETSGTNAFAKTRLFYARLGYDLQATLRDYWEDGDDKVIFAKRL